MCLQRWKLCVILERFDRPLQLLVFRLLGGLFLVGGGSCGVIVIGEDGVVIGIGNQDVGSDGGILNGFSRGRIILRDGEDHGRTIWNFDDFLHGAYAESFVSENIATLILED